MFVNLNINKEFEFKIYVYYFFENKEIILKVILINLKSIFKSLRLNNIFKFLK